MSDWNAAPAAPSQQPGAFDASFEAPLVRGQGQRRRRVDVSALVTVLVGIPWAVLSLCVVAVASLFVGDPWATWIVLGWLLSGVLAFVRVTEDVVARLMLRFRKPTEAERVRFEGAWTSVLQSAGVPKNRYRLWIQDADDVNAYASGGHIVAVTRWALNSLQPRQLEAVLAHELGHHLGGHSWAALLTYWYSIPARLFWAIVRVVTRLVLVVVSIFSVVGYLIGLLMVGLFCFGYFSAAMNTQSLFAQFVMFGPLLAPIVVAYFGRRAEMASDKTAAQLGYGRDLLSVLVQWQHEGHDVEAQKVSEFRRLFATHPLVATRIRALESYLSRTGQ